MRFCPFCGIPLLELKKDFVVCVCGAVFEKGGWFVSKGRLNVLRRVVKDDSVQYLGEVRRRLSE